MSTAAAELRFRILACVLDSFARTGKSVDSALDAQSRLSLIAGLNDARRDVLAPTSPLSLRLAAFSALGRYGTDQSAELELIPRLLAPREPPEIQSAAADALVRIADPTVPKLLLAAWPDAAPALRSHILDLLLALPDGAKAVLDAIEKDTIPARFIDAPRRQQLLKHRDSSIRAAAAKLFDAATNSDRAKLLTDYQDVTTMKADFDRGKLVFANRCSTCHHLNGVGHHVGPDLGQLANKSPAYLLQEILDPNKQVDSRFVEYAATTKSGKVFRGIIAAESRNERHAASGRRQRRNAPAHRDRHARKLGPIADAGGIREGSVTAGLGGCDGICRAAEELSRDKTEEE